MKSFCRWFLLNSQKWGFAVACLEFEIFFSSHFFWRIIVGILLPPPPFPPITYTSVYSTTTSQFSTQFWAEYALTFLKFLYIRVWKRIRTMQCANRALNWKRYLREIMWKSWCNIIFFSPHIILNELHFNLVYYD